MEDAAPPRAANQHKSSFDLGGHPAEPEPELKPEPKPDPKPEPPKVESKPKPPPTNQDNPTRFGGTRVSNPPGGRSSIFFQRGFVTCNTDYSGKKMYCYSDFIFIES